MSDCEEKIYSNDYVDFIISKDVLDVIDLQSDCIQKAEKMQCGSGRKRGECKTSFSWKNTAGHGVRIGGSLGGGKYAGLFH